MTTSAKREFKRFEGFYLKGTLEGQYLKRLKERYERDEVGVVQSWFDYCEEKHGKVDQTRGEVFDMLETKGG